MIAREVFQSLQEDGKCFVRLRLGAVPSSLIEGEHGSVVKQSWTLPINEFETAAGLVPGVDPHCLKIDHPEECRMRVSHESIYAWIRMQAVQASLV